MKQVMTALLACGAALAAAAGARAATPQPPMNNFNSAYYVCQGDAQFMISYDAAKPKSAKLTTSNNSKTYALKRNAVQSGVQFSGDGATFWTDGNDVRVDGTQIPMTGCKRKS